MSRPRTLQTRIGRFKRAVTGARLEYIYGRLCNRWRVRLASGYVTPWTTREDMLRDQLSDNLGLNDEDSYLMRKMAFLICTEHLRFAPEESTGFGVWLVRAKPVIAEMPFMRLLERKAS